ncbi:MAG TPA: protein kinase [Kineosporiaceae bacterium]
MNVTGGAGDRNDPLPAGDVPRVPGLRVLRLLGAGGQGEVWLADDLASGDQVAVKIGFGPATSLPPSPPTGVRLPPSDDGASAPSPSPMPPAPPSPSSQVSAGAGDGGPARRLSREIALLRRIDHPHVVRLRRVVDLPGGGRALVLDHAAGGSLGRLVRTRGPLTPGEACAVVVPLADTLADLHARGLVHGDLTPSNVLFTLDGRPLIADLGSAWIMGEPVSEVWASDGYADPARSGRPAASDDVYALGALLRFALTGSPTAPGPSASGGSGHPRDLAGSAGRVLRASPESGAPAIPGGAGSVSGHGPRDPLLALADLCTSPSLDLRPDLRSVSRAALAATPAVPVRLVPQPPGRQPTSASASSAEASVAAGPVVVRIDPRVRRPRSATEAGWTRSAVPSSGTAPAEAATTSTALPPTRGDLSLLPFPGPSPRSRPGTGTDAAPAAAVTRRRLSVTPRGSVGDRGPDPAPESARRRDLRRGRHQLPGSGAMSTSRALLLSATVAVVAAVGWWGLGGPHGPGARPRPDPGPGEAPTGARPSVPAGQTPTPAVAPGRAAASIITVPADHAARSTTDRETVDAALARLARGRAEAFRQLSEASLADVDEPGSEASARDLELLARLKAAGVRLEGLSFTMADVQVSEPSSGVAIVLATVTASAHQQVSVQRRRTVAEIAPAEPRPVVFRLVAAPDGVHWLVRQVWSTS